MNSPCLNCEYRKVGCHGFCRSYKEYKDKLGALKKRDEYMEYMTEAGGGYDRMKTKRGVMRI